MLDKDLVPVTNRYAIVESSMKSFLHGYVVHFHFVLYNNFISFTHYYFSIGVYSPCTMFFFSLLLTLAVLAQKQKHYQKCLKQVEYFLNCPNIVPPPPFHATFCSKYLLLIICCFCTFSFNNEVIVTNAITNLTNKNFMFYPNRRHN